MPRRHRFKVLFTATVTGAILASICPPAWANGADKTEPLALRKIMRDLGKNMQDIAGGISREDWKMVGQIAPLVADHPQPPLAEKMRILKFAGVDAGKFKGHDEKVHQAARSLEQAAVLSNGQAVISAFATLQDSCLACHQSFRKPFLEHFYGQH